MSCVLRISGRQLDVDKLPKLSSIRPFDIYKKGQPVLQTKPQGKKLTESGLTFDVSTADMTNFRRQAKDAIKYLSKNKSDIKKLTKLPAATQCYLDFGIESTVGKSNFFQTECFTKELLKLAADLSLDICFTLYPKSDD